MTTKILCFYLQNRLIQTNQTGGQWYSDTSPFSIPWAGKCTPTSSFENSALLDKVCLWCRLIKKLSYAMNLNDLVLFWYLPDDASHSPPTKKLLKPPKTFNIFYIKLNKSRKFFIGQSFALCKGVPTGGQIRLDVLENSVSSWLCPMFIVRCAVSSTLLTFWLG